MCLLLYRVDASLVLFVYCDPVLYHLDTVGTKGVSQNHLLSFDDNKVLKIVNWIC